MIGVGVSIKDGVEAVEVGAQGLVAKIGRCIDEYAMRAEANEDGGAKALVARIRRAADLAVATDHGYADAGARSEDEDRCGIEIVQHETSAREARQICCL